MTNPQRPRLRDVYASARPWPWRVACPKLSRSQEPAGPCLHAASCSSRSPTSVCRREAASLQALLAVQHVSEPCAFSLPAALWRPAALGHLSASLQPRPARAPQPVLRVRPAAAIPVTPTASLCAPLWRQSSAPSRYLCALGAFSLHVAVARAYRTYVRLWQVANRSRLLPRCGCG